MLGAAQQIQGTLMQAAEAKDSRLAAVKVGQAAYQAVQANRYMEAARAEDGTAATKEQASAQLQISIGSNKSVSETRRTQETAFGASVMAGGKVAIVALGEQGAPDSGRLSVVGSDIVGKNVLLAAGSDLLLQGQAEQATEISKNKSSGWKLGVGIGANEGGSGVGINVFANAYLGNGKARGNGTTHRETQVSARDELMLISGRDTLIEGAQARADQIRADIGRDLTLQPAGQRSLHVQANAGQCRRQFQLWVDDRQRLHRREPEQDQVELRQCHRADGVVRGRARVRYQRRQAHATERRGDRQRSAGCQEPSVDRDAGFQRYQERSRLLVHHHRHQPGHVGRLRQENKGDAVGGSPSGLSFASTSGSASGTTRTAVAEGQIEVRADALNGRDSTAGLSRDTAGANGSIGKIFDKDKVREKLEFQQALGQLGMQIAGDALKDLAKQDPETWGEGKIGSIALHAGVAGAAAALGGATWRARSPVRWRVTWPRAPCASRSIARWPTSRRNCGRRPSG